MTNKEKYREFCKAEKNIPIFSKDWWLDSVCPENKYWDGTSEEGKIEKVDAYDYITLDDENNIYWTNQNNEKIKLIKDMDTIPNAY